MIDNEDCQGNELSRVGMALDFQRCRLRSEAGVLSFRSSYPILASS